LNITFSAHAFERAFQRGITEAEIISVLTKPDSKTQRHRSGKTGGFVYLFTKEMAGGTNSVLRLTFTRMAVSL